MTVGKPACEPLPLRQIARSACNRKVRESRLYDDCTQGESASVAGYQVPTSFEAGGYDKCVDAKSSQERGCSPVLLTHLPSVLRLLSSGATHFRGRVAPIAKTTSRVSHAHVGA